MSICDTLPNCTNPCAPDLSAQSLNNLLVPTNLQSMSAAQRCAYVEMSNSRATTLRNQIVTFIGKAANAKRQLSKRRFTCPYRVPWTTSTSPLIINQRSLANYYDLMVTSNAGFAYIARCVLTFLRRQRKCKINQQNGFADCSNCTC